MNNWNGKEIYNWFIAAESPFETLTIPLNIKGLKEIAKEKKTTTNNFVMYAIGKAVEEVPEFRIRHLQTGDSLLETRMAQKENDLVMFDHSCISPPVPAKGKPGGFNFCNIDWHSNLDEFLKTSRETIKAAEKRDSIYPNEYRPDAVYLSHVNTYYLAKDDPTNGRFDITPRISWGAPDLEADNTKRVMIPFTLKVNHAVISGPQMEKFYSSIKKTFNAIGNREY